MAVFPSRVPRARLTARKMSLRAQRWGKENKSLQQITWPPTLLRGCGSFPGPRPRKKHLRLSGVETPRLKSPQLLEERLTNGPYPVGEETGLS